MKRNSFPESGLSSSMVEGLLSQSRSDSKNPLETFSDRWINDCGLLIDDGALEVAKSAYMEFFTKNNSYAPVMKFERDLVSMSLELFHGGSNAVGNLTSGGTESLFLATLMALSHGWKKQRNARKPEIIMPESAHPAFEKFSRYLGLGVRRVAVDSEFRADPKEIEQAISKSTQMIIASISSWTHGACDPVAKIAEIAEAKGIWFHVDACVGGFLAPFVVDLGRDVPNFDFRVQGVSSISADFHKYGYSGKGVSGIFYGQRELCKDQIFAFDTWAAGLYRSANFTGTRSGGAIASAWAVMRFLGRGGYRNRAAQILKARDALVELTTRMPELKLLGRADLGTVAIGSDFVDIYKVASRLEIQGWTIKLLKNPSAIQFVLGPLRDKFVEKLVSDLNAAVQDVCGSKLEVESPQVVYSDEICDPIG